MKLCSEDQWESLVRADDSATFFQTPAWHRLAAKHFGAACSPLLFEFPDFPGSPACLPLLQDVRWGRKRFFSPFGTYTALLSPRRLAQEETTAIEAALARQNIHLASSPLTKNPIRIGQMSAAQTQWIELAGLDADNVTADWSPDPRRKLRMAREAGVTVRVANSDADWAAYQRVYEKSLARWGDRATSRYPASLFHAIAALPAGSMRLWLAEHDGHVAAGYIAFYHNRHACVWHGASDPAFFKLGAVQMLYSVMIADAAREDYDIFDLLGSGGTASLEAFKASLGATTRTYESSLNRTGLIGWIAAKRDGLRGRPTSMRRASAK